jgi:hypothetical protein
VPAHDAAMAHEDGLARNLSEGLFVLRLGDDRAIATTYRNLLDAV